ncbi:MAG: hypothetical protein WA908_10965 [Pontixanthobacter sp.]
MSKATRIFATVFAACLFTFVTIAAAVQIPSPQSQIGGAYLVMPSTIA